MRTEPAFGKEKVGIIDLEVQFVLWNNILTLEFRMAVPRWREVGTVKDHHRFRIKLYKLFGWRRMCLIWAPLLESFESTSLKFLKRQFRSLS